MKILVYGAGVLGCNLARNLLRTGKDVTLFARGNWAAEIKQNGLRIKDKFSLRTSVSRIPVVTELAPDAMYDVIFVVLRYTQLDSALDTLRANRTKNIVFAGCSPLKRRLREKRKKQQKRLPANGKKKDRISSVSRKIPIFSFQMRRQCFLNCFLNIYKYRFIMRCCNPRRPSWAAVWRPCPLPLTTRRKELPTSTLRTTKRVRHRSPMKFPKLSAVRQLSNKPA